MIICDTTSVNSGSANRVVIRLKRAMKENGLPRAQFVGCQLHMLKLILRKREMDEVVGGSTTSLHIHYLLANTTLQKYENYTNVLHKEKELTVEDLRCRDDIKFLYELHVIYRNF